MARALIFMILPFLAAADTNSLRGTKTLMACSGEGNLPTIENGSPRCYGGQLLMETFSLKVLSFDGSTGVVDMKAEGPQAGQCDGAAFQNQDNAVTIENEADCGLGSAEYSVRYCPDQDQFVVNIVKPWTVQVALSSQACSTPAAGGEV
ncbi:stt3 [Symbiodinium natans]|uniref:Stt3 protein n=1 Tax=Symbiodinium natans TaxID=878477 RepID=A0A812IN68_9DINO|nr:stt3 [Symbiodinium natans]